MACNAHCQTVAYAASYTMGSESNPMFRLSSLTVVELEAVSLTSGSQAEVILRMELQFSMSSSQQHGFDQLPLLYESLVHLAKAK